MIITACRACGSRAIAPILDLGATPLANALLTRAEVEEIRRGERIEPMYPLEVVFCAACSLVQITKTVPPEELFSRYVYFSSTSSEMVEHARSLAHALVMKEQLDHESLVVEIASNDGYLLQHYVARGIPVLGIEPAANVAEAARARGVRTETAFFGHETAEHLRSAGVQADVVHAHNVLAHVPDLPGFVRGLATILADDGVVVVEVPYVRDLVDTLEFDTIYHEHLSYFSFCSLVTLFEDHGLDVFAIDRLEIHGGSLRVFAGKPSAHAQEPSVMALIREERKLGMLDGDFYRSLDLRVNVWRTQMLQLLADLPEDARTAAYGASAKGVTLLHVLGVHEAREAIEYVVDQSPHKRGLYTPGTHLEILDAGELRARMPDVCVLLTWNFLSEIVVEQREYLRAGGDLLVPISPEGPYRLVPGNAGGRASAPSPAASTDSAMAPTAAGSGALARPPAAPEGT